MIVNNSLIIDLFISWKHTASGEAGRADVYRVGIDNSLKEAYAALNYPHGDSLDGLNKYLANVIASGASPFAFIGQASGGYEPVINAVIIAEGEEDIAPAGSLGPYQIDRSGLLFTLSEIEAAAPEDEDGRKWAYASLTCGYWATSEEDTIACEDNPECELEHCPHCAAPLFPLPLRDFLDLQRDPISMSLAVAAYASNCGGECHSRKGDYMAAAGRMANKAKAIAALRAKKQEEAGRYAHITPDHVKPAARTCPTCGEEARPIAVKSQGPAHEPAKWLLTWDCGQRHYNLQTEGAIAAWPFAEGLATAADLAAAGFWVK